MVIYNPKALSIQGILNIPLSLQGLKVLQDRRLKVSPRIQGFYSHLIYYKGSRFSKDSRSLLLFDSIQGLTRLLQGFKVYSQGLSKDTRLYYSQGSIATKLLRYFTLYSFILDQSSLVFTILVSSVPLACYLAVLSRPLFYFHSRSDVS